MYAYINVCVSDDEEAWLPRMLPHASASCENAVWIELFEWVAIRMQLQMYNI